MSLINNEFALGTIVRKLIIGTAVAAITATTASMSSAGGAYPDNWAGGPPLPPIGQTTYVQQPQAYYVQPQVQYIQPQVQYIQPQTAYVQPQVQYVQPQAYSTRSYNQTYSYQQAAPAVQGPASSRCIVSNLNGTQWQDGCGQVRINPADVPHLRQKFSAYRPNSGYVLNLPSDFEYMN